MKYIRERMGGTGNGGRRQKQRHPAASTHNKTEDFSWHMGKIEGCRSFFFFTFFFSFLFLSSVNMEICECFGAIFGKRFVSFAKGVRALSLCL